MVRTAAIAAIAIVALAASGWGVAELATPPAPAAATAEAPARQVPVPQPAADSDEATTMLLPDGTRVATLNGASGARPLSEVWPKARPWSPIVGVERSAAGVDWYVHADGTRTTTVMRWRADLGREDALTRVAEPIPQDAAPAGTPPDGTRRR